MQTETKLPDPLVATASPDRPNYAFGVMLDAKDFTDEQTYHRARLARALQCLHGAGTVAGLKVTKADGVAATPDTQAHDEEIRVEPGLAIDPVGRLIEIPRPWCISVKKWWQVTSADALTAALKPPGRVVADLFVRFVACGRGRTPAFASGPFDALDASVYSRVRDAFELRLVPRSEDAPPLPVDPWAAVTGGTVAARVDKAREATLGMWSTLVPEESATRHDRDHVPAILDPKLDWLFLARCTFPATAAPDRPTRTAAPASVDNNGRQFSFAAGALLRIVGP